MKQSLLLKGEKRGTIYFYVRDRGFWSRHRTRWMDRKSSGVGGDLRITQAPSEESNIVREIERRAQQIGRTVKGKLGRRNKQGERRHTEPSLKVTVFWNVTPCRLLPYCRGEGDFCHRIKSTGQHTDLKRLADYTASSKTTEATTLAEGCFLECDVVYYIPRSRRNFLPPSSG